MSVQNLLSGSEIQGQGGHSAIEDGMNSLESRIARCLHRASHREQSLPSEDTEWPQPLPTSIRVVELVIHFTLDE